MRDLSALIPDWGRLPESDSHGKVIHDAAVEGMAPFRPKMIFSFLEYDIDHNEYVITVDLRFKSDPWQSQMIERVRINAFHLSDDPDGSVFKASRELVNKLRYRPRRHIDNPYIQLGDN